ncbi:hypothetical protein BafACA1_0456 [Borreliella afzelii ACA-1]|nr:hypothetical protein P612_02260 [Borreliella afzelii Tom3107]EEC21033.1 hypothetical protein BafACA1_0456 [Borreliella afzelii ACA-1]
MLFFKNLEKILITSLFKQNSFINIAFKNHLKINLDFIQILKKDIKLINNFIIQYLKHNK